MSLIRCVFGIIYFVYVGKGLIFFFFLIWNYILYWFSYIVRICTDDFEIENEIQLICRWGLIRVNNLIRMMIG